MNKKLCRMSIEEKSPFLQEMAAEIHKQIDYQSGHVDVENIAYALDVVEIRREILTSCEGVLITPINKSEGAILINNSSPITRQRFSIAHELGHLIIESHIPNSAQGFVCDENDFRTNSLQDITPYKKQEAEANQFAIELLAPRFTIDKKLIKGADLQHIISLSEELQISKEAAARRYVECSKEPIAILFTKHHRITSRCWNKDFPFLSIKSGETIKVIASTRSPNTVSPMMEADPQEWLSTHQNWRLQEQELIQKDGHAMILLVAEECEECEEHEEDSDEFFKQW